MPDEKRKELRLPLESRTFIELVAPAAGSDAPGELCTCISHKVSRRGIDVVLGQEVTVGAILQIGVDLPAATETLYLAGEVKWCTPTKDSQLPWAAGFYLLNDGDSDIDRWIAFLVEMER